MPTYDFECFVCGATDEVIQPMDAPSELDCPMCNEKNAFRKVFLTAPTAFVKGEPTTIGQLADKNTNALGKYERQSKELMDEVRKKHINNDKASLHKEINSMTAKQKDHWIKTGEKP